MLGILSCVCCPATFAAGHVPVICTPSITVLTWYMPYSLKEGLYGILFAFEVDAQTSRFGRWRELQGLHPGQKRKTWRWLSAIKFWQPSNGTPTAQCWPKLWWFRPLNSSYHFGHGLEASSLVLQPSSNSMSSTIFFYKLLWYLLH